MHSHTKSTAEVLLNNYIVHYGISERIQSEWYVREIQPHTAQHVRDFGAGTTEELESMLDLSFVHTTVLSMIPLVFHQII